MTFGMRRRLSGVLKSVVTAGFVLIAAAKLVIAYTASASPDAASGRTEPVLFAPVVSPNWHYVTVSQQLLLGVLIGITLLCAAAWALLWWRDRRPGPDMGKPVPAAAAALPETLSRDDRSFSSRIKSRGRYRSDR